MHGEYAHLVAHHDLALGRGMGEDEVLRCTDGDRVKLTSGGVFHDGRVPDGHVMVDESGRMISDDLLEERRAMSGEGFVFVRVMVDSRKGQLAEPVVVESRGWVEPDSRDNWHERVADEVAKALAGPLADGNRDAHELRRLTRRATGRLVARGTGRKPTLVPVVEVR